MQSDYVHLHTHTRFSVRDGLPSPRQIVEYAKASGHRVLAITDHGSMGGHYQFAMAAADTETKDGRHVGTLRPIFGIEAYVCDDINVRQSIEVTDADGGRRSRRPKHRHVVFLAKNNVGYSNLLDMMRIATDPESGYYYEPRVDWGIIERHHEGLICMSACLAGEVSRFVRDGDMINARVVAGRYRDLFGDDFYLELQYHGMPEERDCYGQVEAIADDLGIPLVATNDVHYTQRSDAATHALLVAMRFMKTERDGGSSDTRNLRDAYKQSEFYLKDAGQMAELFKRRPDAIAHTVEIAEKCEFEYPLAHAIIWPKYTIPTGDMPSITERRQRIPEHSEKQTLLVLRVIEGLKRLGLDGDIKYAEQAKRELDVIFDLGYEDYFLVQDLICSKVRDANIAMGPGRGCLGGDSLILTADGGFRPLRTITSGDVVYTHTGSLGLVETTFRYPVDEGLLRIKTDNSFSDVVLTKDHLVYGVSPVETDRYKRGGESTKASVKHWEWAHSPRWISASELKPNDLLFMPFPKRTTISYDDIDLSEYAVGKTYQVTDDDIITLNPITGQEVGRHCRHIPFDEDFAYFLGYWIGDGWVRNKIGERKYTTGLSFHSDDSALIDRFSGYFRRLGFTVKTRKAKDKKLVQMDIYNKVLMTAVSSIFPDYQMSCHTKYIGGLKYLPLNLLRSLMLGLKHADGSTEDNGPRGQRESIDTVSVRLALDIREALLYLGLPSSIRKRIAPSTDGGEYQMSDSYKVRFAGLEVPRGANTNGMLRDDGYYVRVLNIDSVVDTEVFDLGISGENHSYLTSNYAVHNSGAGSVVLYALGVTKIDPIKNGLIFERFLNPGRGPQFDHRLELPEFEVEQNV